MNNDNATYCDEDIEGDESVDILASDFLGRYRNGDHPTVEEYVERHPQWSHRIRQMFPLVLSLEKIKVERQTSSDGCATLAGRAFTRLGDFSIVREVGRGGMGIVFEAEQVSLGRRVAVKVLPKQSLLDEQSLERFHREAKTAAAMHHTNIVPIFGTGEADGTHYIVMQLVKGKSLDQIINQKEPLLTEERIASIGKQIADALAYAHSVGVLHRDVKPANILIEENGTAQVTDFGLARNTSDDPTVTRTLSGSMRYMAPERFRGISDPRCDVYSLGLTLYEMLAGEPAFGEIDQHQLMEAIRNLQPRALKALRPTVSTDLETIILKAINPEATLRYATAEALRDDLDRFLFDEPIHARRMTWLQGTVRWCRRNRRLAAALGIAATAMLIATFASTSAYFSTSAANRRSSEALLQTNQTISLALQSLGDVVDTISIPSSTISDPSLGDFARTEFSLISSPPSARVLERILPIYERLAEQSPTRPDIIMQMIEGGLRLAQIQHQLGQTTTAIDSLQRSIDLLEKRTVEASLSPVDNHRYLAILHNELGTFLANNMDFEAANKAHQAAISFASNLHSTDFVGMLELARAHLRLGDLSQQSLQGDYKHLAPRALFKEHLDKASEILEPLRKHADHRAKSETLFAKVLLARSRLATNPVVKQERLTEGISILRSQLDESPDDTSARYAMVEALADVRLNRDALSPRHNRAAAERLQQALIELEPLRKLFPDAPVFAMLEVRIWRGLFAIDSSNEQYTRASEHLQKAINIQTELVETFPDSMPHRCWRVILYESLAKNFYSQKDFKNAEQAIEKAMLDLDKIPESVSIHPLVLQTRQRITELLNSIIK
jgi:eukaryotic-like serine/threonine-protein kinase